MSKANHIRKKALDFVKKRQWDQALTQYIRLSEIESQNPNVFNELGDLHLKMGNKRDAFAAFHSAIDAYSRVSLFNNAVAVCKKIIRLNPTDHYVFGKLARLRNRQGFKQDAAKHAMNFLDLVCEDARINPDDLKEQVTQMGEEIHHSPEVLEKIAGYLTKWEFKEEAAAVLGRLAAAYTAAGMESKSQDARARLAALGAVAEAVPPAASEAGGPDEAASEDPKPEIAEKGPVMAGLENHRVKLDPSVARAANTSTPDTPSPAEAPAAVAERETQQQTGVRTETGEVEKPVAPPAPDPPPAGPDVTEVIDARPAEPRPHPPSAPAAADAPESGDPASRPQGGSDTPSPTELAEDEVWVPQEELPDDLRKGDGEAPGEVVNISDIVSQFDAKVRADVDREDYRSHYDLGMAYLEMDLLSEAIREFQFASNSSLYQVRCLEMIGLCFLKQNQPRLAIKQLEKGLDLVDEGDRDSLGLQYNLGLAYEMTGDDEKARMCFEDVYVVDVAFRDVSEKIKKYTS